MSKATQSDVIAVIEKALELEAGSLAPDTPSNKVSNWDSLGHLSILLALDEFFEGKVAAIDEMAEAKSVDKILALLKQHALL